MIGTMPPETGIPWPACSQVEGLASRSPILLADHHLSLSASCVDARDALWKGSEC
eukprot:jgi/Astpho2/8420/Aster-07608